MKHLVPFDRKISYPLFVAREVIIPVNLLLLPLPPPPPLRRTCDTIRSHTHTHPLCVCMQISMPKYNRGMERNNHMYLLRLSMHRAQRISLDVSSVPQNCNKIYSSPSILHSIDVSVSIGLFVHTAAWWLRYEYDDDDDDAPPLYLQFE